MKTAPIISIDIERHDVTVGGTSRHLAPKEFAILALLAQAKERVLSRDNILTNCWGDGYKDKISDSRTVDQHVARLRGKLGRRAAALLVTQTTAGYKLLGAELVTQEVITGRVGEIKRTYVGGRPKTTLTVHFDDLLAGKKRGDTLRLA